MFTIGQLAAKCGVNIDTIRYYERIKLLKPTVRSEAGYRLYSEDCITQLKFVRCAQTLNFTLSEIAQLLALQSSRNKNCGEVKAKAKQKLIEIEDKIVKLTRIKEALHTLIEDCPGEGSAVTQCSILHYISACK